MATMNRSTAVSALDPHHPLIRRLIRRVQLRDHALLEAAAAGDVSAMLPRVVHVGDLLADVCAHVRRAVPRVEHDEAAQQLLVVDGAPVGRLRRPAPMPDQLHPMLEAAIVAHVCSDDEGDADAAAECADVDLVATVPR